MVVMYWNSSALSQGLECKLCRYQRAITYTSLQKAVGNVLKVDQEVLHSSLFCRREAAVMACEWALALSPICTALGILRHNQSMVDTFSSPSFLLTLTMWMGFCFKAACRQVRPGS